MNWCTRYGVCVVAVGVAPDGERPGDQRLHGRPVGGGRRRCGQRELLFVLDHSACSGGGPGAFGPPDPSSGEGSMYRQGRAKKFMRKSSISTFLGCRPGVNLLTKKPAITKLERPRRERRSAQRTTLRALGKRGVKLQSRPTSSRTGTPCVKPSEIPRAGPWPREC